MLMVVMIMVMVFIAMSGKCLRIPSPEMGKAMIHVDDPISFIVPAVILAVGHDLSSKCDINGAVFLRHSFTHPIAPILIAEESTHIFHWVIVPVHIKVAVEAMRV